MNSKTNEPARSGKGHRLEAQTLLQLAQTASEAAGDYAYLVGGPVLEWASW